MTPAVIPDAFIGGYLVGNPGARVEDAVAWWLDQDRLAARWHAENTREHEEGDAAV